VCRPDGCSRLLFSMEGSLPAKRLTALATTAPLHLSCSSAAGAWKTCRSRPAVRRVGSFKNLFQNEGLCVLTWNPSAVSSRIGGRGGALSL